MTRAWLLRRLVGDGRRHLSAWLALATAFAVVAFAAAGARLLARAAAAPARPPVSRVIAYLADDLADPRELERVLVTLPGVEAVRAVSPREGLELLRRELGARASVLEGVGPDLLAPSLEIDARPAEAAALAFRLRRLRGVADVDLVAAPAPAPPPTAAASALAAISGLAFGLVLALAGVLGVVAALARLRARLRDELGLWFALGLPRAASARPAAWLATGASALGAAAGVVAAVFVARRWLGAAGLPPREVALGAAVLLAVAAAAARLALRAPEVARAR